MVYNRHLGQDTGGSCEIEGTTCTVKKIKRRMKNTRSFPHFEE